MANAGPSPVVLQALEVQPKPWSTAHSLTDVLRLRPQATSRRQVWARLKVFEMSLEDNYDLKNRIMGAFLRHLKEANGARQMEVSHDLDISTPVWPRGRAKAVQWLESLGLICEYYALGQELYLGQPSDIVEGVDERSTEDQLRPLIEVIEQGQLPKLKVMSLVEPMCIEA
jgi:hypothetical protein